MVVVVGGTQPTTVVAGGKLTLAFSTTDAPTDIKMPQ